MDSSFNKTNRPNQRSWKYWKEHLINHSHGEEVGQTKIKAALECVYLLQLSCLESQNISKSWRDKTGDRYRGHLVRGVLVPECRAERAKAGTSRTANNLEIWRPGTDS